MFRSSVAFASVATAASQAVTSCNTADAHFKNMNVVVTPDPPVLGEDVTFVVSGALDKQVTAGSMTLSIKAGPINFPITIPFKNNKPSSNFEAGDGTFTLGPFTYPNINVPLIKNSKGKFELVDQDSEQVACAEWILPAYSETAPTFQDAPLVDCSDPSSAHFTIDTLDVEPPTISKGKPFTVRTAGTLDEDITAGSFDFNVDVSLFKLGISSPFSMSSSIAASDMDISVGPITLPNIPLLPHAKGGVHVKEQNSEEVTCINFNMPLLDEAISV